VAYFDGFDQVAYVTNDMPVAIGSLERKYGLSFQTRMELEIQARVGAVEGIFQIAIAVAAMDGAKLELIQPLRDIAGFYSDFLSPDREAGLGLHHLGARVAGDDVNSWNARYRELQRSGNVYVAGEVVGDWSEHIKFSYADERASLGHYIEHYWVNYAALKPVG
jgi:hypothetical protein